MERKYHEVIEKSKIKYLADNVIFRITTKKHMLEYPDLVFECLKKATEVLELQHGVPSDFHCATHDDRFYEYEFSDKGMRSFKNRLLKGSDLDTIKLLYGFDPAGNKQYSSTLAYIGWSLDRYRTFHWGEPYASSSCDTFTFGINNNLFAALANKKEVFDFFLWACVELEAVHGYIDISEFVESSEQEYLFGFNRLYFDESLLIYCDQFVRGWFWGNVLSEQHIQKLGGMERIIAEAPFEIIKPLQTSDGHELVYLQLTDDVLSQTEVDKQKSFDYLRSLFYSKEVFFEVLAANESVFATKEIIDESRNYPPVERYTTEEMDKLTGLTLEERDQWDTEKLASYQQRLAEYEAKKAAETPTPKETEELMERINTMMKAMIDDWVKESTADYFDDDEMDALLKELEQKIEQALAEEYTKHDEQVFSAGNKAEMLGYAVGYAEHWVNM
jgi:hypothetical protein